MKLTVSNVTDGVVTLDGGGCVATSQPIDNVNEISDHITPSNCKCKDTYLVPEFLILLLVDATKNVSVCEADFTQFLTRNADVFMEPGGKLGRTTLVEYRINTQDCQPTKQQLLCGQCEARRIKENDCAEQM